MGHCSYIYNLLTLAPDHSSLLVQDENASHAKAVRFHVYLVVDVNVHSSGHPYEHLVEVAVRESTTSHIAVETKQKYVKRQNEKIIIYILNQTPGSALRLIASM